MGFFSLVIDESITIAKPVEDVFRLVARWDVLLPRIDPDVLTLEKTTPGPVGVGTSYREVLKTGWMRTEIIATFTEFDSPHSYRYTAVADTLVGGGHMRVDGEDGSARFRVHLEGKPRGFGWLLIPILKSDMAKREKRRLANMKRLMESDVLAPPAVESHA